MGRKLRGMGLSLRACFRAQGGFRWSCRCGTARVSHQAGRFLDGQNPGHLIQLSLALRTVTPDVRNLLGNCLSLSMRELRNRFLAVMSIRRYLSELKIRHRSIRHLGIAFETAVVAFQQKNSDGADVPRDEIANAIIELAHAGERNPDRLCNETLRALRLKEL